ncbi:LON peptidase N-terminal domain and RING finger protein 1-like [Metopolophium dirhodum]|uniref:LON peptidase N-terminal domain and RING finger protein 1-like n=1 Tax=Metopolophium dirhodum TaxID=44670 RepID=UPI00298F63AB|nr:LON peptidase N-terminal domain and RING finger protein 1-like [Metopolophium dirhodum]
MPLTVICQFHLRGECRYGVQCWNSHEAKTFREQAIIDAARNEAILKTSRRLFAREVLRAVQGDQRSINSMNAFMEVLRKDNNWERLDTIADLTNTFIAQLGVDDHYANPAQSTSTNAFIVQVHALCARPSQNASTSTNSTNALTMQVQTQELQLQPEASTRPILKQPDNSKIAMEMVANELSVAMKTGNGNSEKETASNFHALHQKKMKESTGNHGSVWDDILLSAIDSNLLCNICFEIFIKPTVLNCSHTFCESCILIWTDRVIACPICRVEVKSKSYCLTLESFIEKIVEHLPKEIKDKREVVIKDRINMKIERPQRVTHRFNRNGHSGLMYARQQSDAAIPPPQYRLPMDRNADFNTDFLVDESEIFRMNLHDTVVSTGGVNPLMSYVYGPEEQTSNTRITRPYNSSTRH